MDRIAAYKWSGNLLLDADLIGLKPEHVHKMIIPIIDGIADMTVGIFTPEGASQI